jgi:hypothetical protein
MNRVGDNLIHTRINKELVAALIHYEVEFLVVGGLGVSWYCSERQADDMDLLINPTSENAVRISLALNSLNLRFHDSSSLTRPGMQVPLKDPHYADLLTPREGGPTFEEASATATAAKLFEFPVEVASPRVIIQMKRQAISESESQRNKHIADIQCLEECIV